MKTNVVTSWPKLTTAEGAPAYRIGAEQQLRRTALACMLWEDDFYVDGITVAETISQCVAKLPPNKCGDIAVEARWKNKLRHVPLGIVREMFTHPSHRMAAAATLYEVIGRADEITEFMALYWKNGRQPLAAGAKKALRAAFEKFDSHQLAKYDRESGKVRFRDVLRLTHPKPKNKAQSEAWKGLIDGSIESPDTWEVALSSGESKKTDEQKLAEFTRLIVAQKLGAMALLRNLRNLHSWGADPEFISLALNRMDCRRVLPFRFIAAAKAVPHWEHMIEQPFMRSFADLAKVGGKTIILVDVSASMNKTISMKSELTHMDAACSLAMIARECFEDVSIWTFSSHLVAVPLRSGFALRDAIVNSQPHNSTQMGAAVSALSGKYDRLIVITDEQSHDAVPNPTGRGWVINTSVNKNGIGYGAWDRIDGWSESTIEYIIANETGERFHADARMENQGQERMAAGSVG